MLLVIYPLFSLAQYSILGHHQGSGSVSTVHLHLRNRIVKYYILCEAGRKGKYCPQRAQPTGEEGKGRKGTQSQRLANPPRDTAGEGWVRYSICVRIGLGKLSYISRLSHVFRSPSFPFYFCRTLTHRLPFRPMPRQESVVASLATVSLSAPSAALPGFNALPPALPSVLRVCDNGTERHGHGQEVLIGASDSSSLSSRSRRA